MFESALGAVSTCAINSARLAYDIEDTIHILPYIVPGNVSVTCQVGLNLKKTGTLCYPAVMPPKLSSGK